MKHLIAFTTLFIFFAINTWIQAQETGKASFYNKRFNGRRTQSGERLDNNKFTAAHKTLAFGTYVKVTNIKNERWCIVKINDRGRFKKGRIIDVTQAAARELDIIKDGIAQVKIEIIPFYEVETDSLKPSGVDTTKKQDILYKDTLLIDIE